jgi:putative endonuclease
MSSKQYYVYILCNFSKTVLYTGITNNLTRRVWEHKNNLVKGFTERYQVHNLVYYEIFEDPTSAINREKQIKNYSRKKKEEIILEFNPKIKDLYPQII